MNTKTITPWINWQEWKTVVDDAYADDLCSYQRAFSAILAWEARDADMPSGILGLKELIIAKLARQSTDLENYNEMFTYQSTVSMNVVRFVNFITEPFQTNSHAKTVKAIANQIGIPDWIVNLRHSATHFNLPSVEVLEKAVTSLFEFLKERYIDSYKEISLDQSLLNQNVRGVIENLFNEYMNFRYKQTLMRTTNKKNNNESSEDLDKDVQSLVVNFRHDTFDVLLLDGFMIPTNEQLNAMGIIAEEFLEQENLNFPKSFSNIWDKFLSYVNEMNLIGFLFTNLITAYKFEVDNSLASTHENLRNKFLLSWILYLLKFNSYKNEKLKMVKFQFQFSFKKVLHDILAIKPNRFTSLFLYELSKIASFSNEISPADYEKLKTLMNFLNMTNDQTVTDESDEWMTMNETETSADYSLYDMSVFDQYVKKNESTFERFEMAQIKIKSSGNWQMIDDPNWNQDKLKLGFIENQSFINLNLDLGQFCEKNETNGSINNSQNLSFQEALTSPYSKGPIIQNPKNLKERLMINYWEFA